MFLTFYVSEHGLILADGFCQRRPHIQDNRILKKSSSFESVYLPNLLHLLI